MAAVRSHVPRHPPLRVYVLALLLAGLAVLLLSRSWTIEWLTQAPSGNDFNLGRLAATPDDTGLRVVALGTSKTRFALPFDSDFPALKDAAGVPIRFQRYSASSANLTILTLALSALRKNPPDVLLLESDLLLYDRGGPPTRDSLSAFRVALQLLVERVRSALRHPTSRESENRGLERWPGQSTCKASRGPEKLADYEHKANRWGTTTTAQRQGYLEVLRRLQEQGTVIVLLDLPRAPHASLLVSPSLESQVSELRKALQVEEGFHFWSPGEIADELYCDQGHLNRAGRELYTAWLSQHLAAWPLARGQP